MNIFENIKVVNKSSHSLPAYESDGAAGLDLRANLQKAVTLNPMERSIIPTGLYIEMPSYLEAQVRARSGMAIKHGITLVNAVGTIDSDYRGEIGVAVINLGEEPYTISDGDRIAQIVFSPITKVSWKPVISLEETTRGSGGFNSTGKK